MTAEVVDLQEVQARSAGKTLSVEIDDFSIKVVSSQDHLFWVRIKVTDSGKIIITDFNPGNLPLMTLNIALRKALREIHTSTPSNLTFKNISPFSSATYNNTSGYEGPLNAIRAACEGLARVSSRAISSFRVVPDGRKFNVVVALS